jgi:hypothetical protein
MYWMQFVLLSIGKKLHVPRAQLSKFGRTILRLTKKGGRQARFSQHMHNIQFTVTRPITKYRYLVKCRYSHLHNCNNTVEWTVFVQSFKDSAVNNFVDWQLNSFFKKV